jgi:Eco57I restriction-modification methylase
MPLDPTRARQYLKDFDLKGLFVEELGWDHHTAAYQITAGGRSYLLSAVAHKHGFAAFICEPGAGGRIPDYATRRKIDSQLTKFAHEHLVIFVDEGKTTQIWQWLKKEPGKPVACRERTYHRGHPGEAVIQPLQLLAFSIEEEGGLALPEVTFRARAALDVEKVTKRFYDRFKGEHAAFLKFLKGIPDGDMQRWYVSVMLNRLMFIYFIQKKAFLDNNPSYLRDKLAESKKRAKDCFYGDFLCRLFFEGFARKENDRSAATNKLLGTVPYLNGGLFLRHQIEERYGSEIQIADAAFEKLFAFFEQYTWHLDERPLKKDDEINPDVLGHIFEKYVNQKQMGAYYSKEDITGYISQNTVIPFLFDKARKECKIAFEGAHSIWRLLQADPDRYIYDAIKRGVDLKLLPEIAAGLKDVSKRTEWNKPAPEEYALPTEIWREVVARRQRYEEVRCKLGAGEIGSINDLITYNLDIRQFAQDVIETCEGPELLRAFYKAIKNVSVLDPACGSGAFLFAALNILESLYEACLDRMQAFLDELGRSGEKHRPEKFADFKKELERAAAHPNRKYFIFKTIIVNNLFGVDIMEEATEICKLRLFLKLVAQIERLDQIEPLPDIDFNIRAGNTLVGYASYDHVKHAVASKLDFEKTMVRIEEKAQEIDRLFDRFREQQSTFGGDVTPADKSELLLRLRSLEGELNRYLAGEYGAKPNDRESYERWLASHEPFHWFIEFYGILMDGGFDVVIGNPPYVSSSKVRKQYNVRDFRTADCPDIYSWFLERATTVLCDGGRAGLIVPISLGFSGNFAACREVLFEAYNRNWFSSFGRIPSALFSFDVRVRNTIHLGHRSKGDAVHCTTRLHRWFDIERRHLFQRIEYATFRPSEWRGKIPKLDSRGVSEAFSSLMRRSSKTLELYLLPRETPHVLHFKKTAYNWLTFCETLPPCYDEHGAEVEQTKFGSVHFADQAIRDLAMLFLNGKLMFTFWCAVGDDFDLTKWMFAEFPVDFDWIPSGSRRELLQISRDLRIAMSRNVTFKLNAGRRVGTYNLAKCRTVTDRSDRILVQHFRLTRAWDDIDLFYERMVKTDFPEDETGEKGDG